MKNVRWVKRSPVFASVETVGVTQGVLQRLGILGGN